jgi:pyrroline-5-carboxylate reductase
MARARKRIGFIGAGNMAGAMIKGFVAAKVVKPTDVWVADVVADQAKALKRRYGVGVARDNAVLVADSRIVVLAVKPQTLPDVLGEIGPSASDRQLFVSIAAGFTLARLERGLGPGVRVVRVMPNTPALVGQGMSVLVRGSAATQADERTVLRLLRAVGDAIAVGDEGLLDPVTGLSGSGPAFVYLFAEALMAGGEREGLTSDVSRRLALRTLEGASAMLRETGMTPKALRDMVTSPGGTTLAGLRALDRGGFAETVADAVRAATARSRELGRG